MKMNELELRKKYNELFLIYGMLLANSQKVILEDYYCFNLSLSEISLNRNITRSGVLDALNKGRERLDFLETQLQFLRKTRKIHEIMVQNDVNEDIREAIEEVIKNGI